MKRFFRNAGDILEPRSAMWKAAIFIAIPVLLVLTGKWVFGPVDSMGAAMLQFFLSIFSSIETIPTGLGFVFFFGVLWALGILLKYEEKSGRYFLYRLHRIHFVGFAFPAPKSFQFEPCVFWASNSDKKPGAYRGEVVHPDGTRTVIVAEVSGLPSIFGLLHFLEPRFVIRVKLPAAKLITMVTTGAATLPKTDELEPIPWDGESKEEAQRRYNVFPN